MLAHTAHTYRNFIPFNELYSFGPGKIVIIIYSVSEIWKSASADHMLVWLKSQDL